MLQTATTVLDYPITKDISIKKCIDVHSLCVIGANVLALLGYADTQKEKMGHWYCETLMECIFEQYQISLRGWQRA